MVSTAVIVILSFMFGIRCCSDTREIPVSAEAETIPESISENIQEKNSETDSEPAEPEEAASEDIGAESSVSENSVSGNSVLENTVSENQESQEERTRVKGIYVTGPMAGSSKMDSLIDLVDRTELNAMVIDVKNDDGRVTYEMNTSMVGEVGSVRRYVKDMPALIQKCKEKGIYLIARIVAFKDPFLAETRTDLALHDREGNLFRDRSGLAWVNPYRKEVWNYLLEIATDAALTGFDEIQFDYIRFATEKGMADVDFGPEAEGKSKEDIITEFTIYASEYLHALNVPVSADVYGIVIDSKVDAANVGQNYYEMCKYLDAISPMVYPSHYGPGNLGLAVPDAQPYETLYRSMSASRRVLSGYVSPVAETQVSENDIPMEDTQISENGLPSAVIQVSGNEVSAVMQVSGNTMMPEPDPKELEPADEIRASVRPWLQDFTAKWVAGHIPYGPEEIRAQIQGVYDAGYEEWILWNAANRYTEGGLLPETEELR